MLPGYLSRDLKPLALPTPEAAAKGAAPAPVDLNITRQQQEEDQWCWAAAAITVRRHYLRNDTVPQCEIASRVLARPDCCSDGREVCNVTNQLQEAFKAADVSDGSIDTELWSFAEIADHLRGGRPVGVRIGWQGGGGHFVVISGCFESEGNRELTILDPWDRMERQNFDGFNEDGWYRGTGRWTHTYPTRIPLAQPRSRGRRRLVKRNGSTDGKSGGADGDQEDLSIR